MLVALAGSELYSIAASVGLRVSGEAFADRTYLSNGTLTPRSEPGSVIEDAGEATRQAVRLAKEGLVRTRDGADLEVTADTICIHGDGPNAVSFARQVRDGLELAGVNVRC
jgi:5-oxoprolinase (ATP-hydrolysing) subunit A